MYFLESLTVRAILRRRVLASEADGLLAHGDLTAAEAALDRVEGLLHDGYGGGGMHMAGEHGPCATWRDLSISTPERSLSTE